MSIQKYLGKKIRERLTLQDQAAIAFVFFTKGKGAAIKEATKRAAKNIMKK